MFKMKLVGGIRLNDEEVKKKKKKDHMRCLGCSGGADGGFPVFRDSSGCTAAVLFIT